jgi:hypothetical protein
MRRFFHAASRRASVAVAFVGSMLLAGCDASVSVEKPANEPGKAAISVDVGGGGTVVEIGKEAADAVTPDKKVIDVETPIGDVEVTRDPATDQTKVDVKTPGAE